MMRKLPRLVDEQHIEYEILVLARAEVLAQPLRPSPIAPSLCEVEMTTW
ncbi:hypothetical protein [Nocardia anaemiae]|nr:hypothetical protein [Nocardia anaemiae]